MNAHSPADWKVMIEYVIWLPVSSDDLDRDRFGAVRLANQLRKCTANWSNVPPYP